jgi:hypothetical protein
MDEGKDNSLIDNKAAMIKFMDAIKDRAKDLPSNSIENTKPDVAVKALWLLSQGAPYTEIRRITRLSHETIRRLEWDHNTTLEKKRKEFSTRYAMAAMEYTDLLFMKAERIHDNPDLLDDISPEKLATTVGIMQDKSSSLAGITDAGVGQKAGLSIEDALVLIEASKQKRAQKVIDAEVIDA